MNVSVVDATKLPNNSFHLVYPRSVRSSCRNLAMRAEGRVEDEVFVFVRECFEESLVDRGIQGSRMVAAAPANADTTFHFCAVEVRDEVVDEIPDSLDRDIT